MRYFYSFLTSLLIFSNFAFSQTADFTVTVQDSLKPISPYIYGTNSILTGEENWSAIRQGGNRLTGYNWENNASSAGEDWYNFNDSYLTDQIGIYNKDSANVPGIVTAAFQDQAVRMGAFSLVTLQMAGYVAKDKSADSVTLAQTAPSPRWVAVRDVKGSAFSYPPDTSDSYVYMDEYVNFLVGKYGAADSPHGVKAYSLDNEPSLWSSTHPRIHPAQTTCKEIIRKSVALAKAVKSIDPSAEIFGPALYGFNAYNSFQNSPDWNSVSSGKGYSWFIDYYLDQMKKASDTAGTRLLDVLDLHWYSEAMGSDGNRITNSNADSYTDDTARVHAPGTLWVSTHNYVENSWIGQWEKNYLPLIPKLIGSINKYYPGTKLAFTEFSYGGENNITGAIALSDVLGIFGKYAVYFASVWPLSGSTQYISAAYKIFRNYNGLDSTFGNLSIPASSTDYANTSIYASATNGINEIHLIVINKNLNKNITGSFKISTRQIIESGRVWELDSTGSRIHEIDSVRNINNNSFAYVLPAASVCHFVLRTMDVPTEVAFSNIALPVKYYMQAYPNPFNPVCKIDYNCPVNSVSRIDIFSITGELIKSFGRLTSTGSVYWDGTNGNDQKTATGVYCAVLSSSGKILSSRKLILLK